MDLVVQGPIVSVLHAFITPCHIDDPCCTMCAEFMIQFACDGHRPLLDCLVCDNPMSHQGFPWFIAGAPLLMGCLKHQGHKGDPGVTPGTCGAVGERAQVILVWVRAPGVGNASHPRRLGVMRVRP